MDETTIHDALATHTDDYELLTELHRIRPHATYEVRFRGEHTVCKLATHPEGTPAREAAALGYVGAATDVPVPELLAVGEDHFVARWSDAVPQEPPAVDESRVRALGRGLATLHTETAGVDATGRVRPATAVGGSVAPPVDADDRWSDTLLGLLDRRACFLDSVGYGDLARDVADWVREHRGLFDAVDDAVLCHGNYFGEHIGVGTRADEGDVTTVIDFEHALFAPAGWDYLRTVLPLFGPGADHDVSESTFRAAYESVRPLPAGVEERHEAYVLCNEVSYLRSLHLQRGDRDPPEEVGRRARRLAASTRERLATLRASTP